MRKIIGAALVLCALQAASSEPLAAAEQRLEAVVLINRHGTRSPLSGNLPDSNVPITLLARQKWPRFGVKPGNLTRRGAETSKTMGAYYGDYFRRHGLLPDDGCLPADKVWVHADHDQRTIKTARKMMEGMAPGCAYPVGHVSRSKPDPLIDPTGAGICAFDDTLYDAAQDAVLGSSPEIVVDAYGPSLSELQEVLDCCRPRVCRLYGLAPGCTLADLPAGIMMSAAVDISENFLMEYADNMPMSEVGWGRVPGSSTISHINMTHALAFRAGNASPYAAAVFGSNLVYRALTALRQAAMGHGPVLSMIVAHDNNLLNVAGLLGMSWFLGGYQQNQVPPGAGIALELWRNTTTNLRTVSVVVRAQSMDQLRDNTPLSLGGAAPMISDQTPLACGTPVAGARCPFGSFHASVEAALMTRCIDPRQFGR